MTRVPRWMRFVFVANLVAQAAIVVTGAVVRLTGSGLGCPTWPECVEGSYVPVARQAEAWHKYVEFGNRLLTFAVGIVAILAVVAVVTYTVRRARSGESMRISILLLGIAPLAGTFAQAVLGGITVLTGLNPVTVGLHFLVSIALIAAAVALVVRSRDAGDVPVVFLARAEVRVYTWALIAVTMLVVIMGVVTTGSGPHSGDAESEHRFPFDPRTVSWLHADIVLLFIGMLIGYLILIRVTSSPSRTWRTALILAGITLVQAAVGYTQYFSGLPVILVTIHVTLACLLWITVLFLPSTLRTRGT
ncbi:MAG: COX15/CtaA family protein [Candidatus Nanopelagicales bacterium]